MRERILTIAENAWVDLVARKALIVLAATLLFGFIAPLYVQVKMMMARGATALPPEGVLQAIFGVNSLMIFMGLCEGVIFAAGSVETEVSKRTLTAVMIRPIHRWEYLAGRWLGTFAMFLSFVALAAIGTLVASLILDVSLPATYVWGLLQRVCHGAAWILIAFALGTVTSTFLATMLIVIVGLIAWVMPHLSSDVHWLIPWLKKIFYYGLPADWTTDYLELSPAPGVAALLENAAILLENLLYGLTLFLAACWLFAKRDLKLRD
jgi:ABC-type transport system involved in multi-copper enzyme maturation permease subunit